MKRRGSTDSVPDDGSFEPGDEETAKRTRTAEDGVSTVQHSIIVDLPIAAVYKQWVDFESYPEFLPAVREVKLTGEVYSRWTVAISKLSRQFLVEILEQLPEERLVWRTIEGDVWFSGDATFDAIDKQQTRVDVTVHWKPVSAVERTAAALGLAGRVVRGALEAFKTHIESTGGPSGHSRIKVVSPKG
ncbi:SRPBCC family protein [Plantibacter sp. CFBP 8798]|uniref:SRPBCC family protein n=1 Tax=Plantibacter sp. CFBP 8798 TaxID=2775268 RepID=UPI00178520FF|nr:SRPBCC family protein [Plantibacter sp. CFBP 8798]MBD8467788.1 SRPBCC family protein [Plantibacter sp. CFBP 8798]